MDRPLPCPLCLCKLGSWGHRFRPRAAARARARLPGSRQLEQSGMRGRSYAAVGQTEHTQAMRLPGAAPAHQHNDRPADAPVPLIHQLPGRVGGGQGRLNECVNAVKGTLGMLLIHLSCGRGVGQQHGCHGHACRGEAAAKGAGSQGRRAGDWTARPPAKCPAVASIVAAPGLAHLAGAASNPPAADVPPYLDSIRGGYEGVGSRAGLAGGILGGRPGQQA